MGSNGGEVGRSVSGSIGGDEGRAITDDQDDARMLAWWWEGRKGCREAAKDDWVACEGWVDA